MTKIIINFSWFVNTIKKSRVIMSKKFNNSKASGDWRQNWAKMSTEWICWNDIFVSCISYKNDSRRWKIRPLAPSHFGKCLLYISYIREILDLKWYLCRKDILGSSGPRKIDYRSEFTTTLFNIGALHSQLGAADDRTTSEGLKLACTHFQCAAWAFKV